MQVNLQSRSTATRQGFLSTVNIAPNSFQDLSERLTGKRKIGGKVEAPIKRTKFPAYFISELAHIVAFTDERIPFISLEIGKLPSGRGIITAMRSISVNQHKA